MRRVNIVFVVLVAGAVLTGGVAASGFGSELQTIDTIGVVHGQLGTDVTDLRLADGELVVSVRLTNPTGYPIQLGGTFVRVAQEDSVQLAYGAGTRLDDGPERIPSHGRLDARYSVGLTADQADRVRAAFESGPVQVSVAHSLSLGGKSFQLTRSNITVSGEVAG